VNGVFFSFFVIVVYCLLVCLYFRAFSVCIGFFCLGNFVLYLLYLLFFLSVGSSVFSIFCLGRWELYFIINFWKLGFYFLICLYEILLLNFIILVCREEFGVVCEMDVLFFFIFF